jgi:hypothetical protein
MDVVPVVFGRGKRYFGALDAQQLLEDPDILIRSRRLLGIASAADRQRGQATRLRRDSPQGALIVIVRNVAPSQTLA